MANAITQKGQVTIPKSIRDHLGLKPGDKVVFAANDAGRIEIQPAILKREGMLAALKDARQHLTPEFLEDLEACGNDGVAYIRWLRGE